MDADTPFDRLNDFLPGPDELGLDGYVTLRPIGEGGFGRVYLARQTAFERDVAVKVLSATGFQAETAQRFARECRAIGSLSSHPNIVTVYDGGVTSWGRPYIVMDHMAGGSFAQRIVEGPVDEAEAIDAIIKICGAVETAHQSGILHRDIKPENILISSYGEPKLADFGIASIPDGYQTRTGSVTASLAHAAPEVLEGAHATPATDIYALGSTMFTLLTGRGAFASETQPGLQGLIARTMTQPVPDLRAEGIPVEICAVIERAMSKDPAERQASAADLGDELRGAQLALGLPVTDMVLTRVPPELLADVRALAADPLTATQVRKRAQLVPPRPPAPKRAVWRSPVAAALLALVLVGSAGGAIAIRARRGPQSAAPAPLGTVAPIAQTTPAAEKDETQPRKKPSAKRSDKKRRARDGGRIAFSAPISGGSASIYEGDGSVPTGSDAPARSSGGSTTQRSTSDGGDRQKAEREPAPEPKPDPLPAAVRSLYHLWNSESDAYFTAIYDHYSQKRPYYTYNHSEGEIWDRQVRPGMRALCHLGGSRCDGWVFTEPQEGENLIPLYTAMTSKVKYYVTDRSEIPSGLTVYLFGYIHP